MQANVKRYQVTLVPLTPIHIGSGNMLDPYEYIIQQEDGFHILYRVNLDHLFSAVSPAERDDLLEALDSPDLFRQRQTIHKVAVKCFKNSPQLFERFATVSKEFARDHQKILQDPRAQSKLEIHIMTRDATTGFPYVPGSSLKGAIRTAWLNQVADSRPDPVLRSLLSEVVGHTPPFRRKEPTQRQAQVMEAILLENAVKNKGGYSPVVQKDPFRVLQISDLYRTDETTLFSTIARMEILNPTASAKAPKYGSRNRKTAGIQLYCDCLVPAEPGELALTGRLTLQEHLWAAECVDRGSGGSPKVVTGKRFDAAALRAALNAFYKNCFDQEYARYYRKPEWGLHEEAEHLKDQVAAIDGDAEALIRVGRFSQFECMTLAKFDPIVQKPHGKSRTVAKDDENIPCTIPLGWCKLRLDPVTS